jgi:hypothetical protein
MYTRPRYQFPVSDLQRESGLRVLHGLRERKRSIEDAAAAEAAARSAAGLKKGKVNIGYYLLF